MANTPTCSISATGVFRPTLDTILSWYVGKFQSIYGNDVNLDASGIDGEWLGLLSSAMDDTNAMCVQSYNSFSPATAQGTGLSINVKLNGISRLIPSFSTALITVVGQAATPITNGLLTDDAGFNWALPASVTIPYTGQIVVTATCTTLGAIAAPPGTIHRIANSQPGWQTATNAAAATLGQPVESDVQLRRRQSLSTMNASTALLDGIVGGVLALPNVLRARGYQNTTNNTDDNGLPGNTLAIVADGGDVDQILNMIWRKKGGCGTFGSTTRTIIDAYGIPLPVAYFPVTEILVKASIGVRQKQAFTLDVPGMIQKSVAAEIEATGIGNTVELNRLYTAAYLNGDANGRSYEITSLLLTRDATWHALDVPIDFDEAAHGDASQVIITVT